MVEKNEKLLLNLPYGVTHTAHYLDEEYIGEPATPENVYLGKKAKFIVNGLALGQAELAQLQPGMPIQLPTGEHGWIDEIEFVPHGPIFPGKMSISFSAQVKLHPPVPWIKCDVSLGTIGEVKEMGHPINTSGQLGLKL